MDDNKNIGRVWTCAQSHPTFRYFWIINDLGVPVEAGAPLKMPFAADTNDFHMNMLLSNDGEGVRSR